MRVRELFEDTEDFVQRWIAKHKNLVAQIHTDLFTKSVRDDPEFKARLEALPPGVEDAIWADVGAGLARDTENFRKERDRDSAKRIPAPRPTLRRVK